MHSVMQWRPFLTMVSSSTLALALLLSPATNLMADGEDGVGYATATMDIIEDSLRIILDREHSTIDRATTYRQLMEQVNHPAWVAAHGAYPQRVEALLDGWMRWMLPGMEQFLTAPRVPANAASRNTYILGASVRAWGDFFKGVRGDYLRSEPDVSKPDPLFDFMDGVVFYGGLGFLQALQRNHIGNSAVQQIIDSWLWVRYAPANPANRSDFEASLPIARHRQIWQSIDTLLTPKSPQDFEAMRSGSELDNPYFQQRLFMWESAASELLPLFNYLTHVAEHGEAAQRRTAEQALNAIFSSGRYQQLLNETTNRNWQAELLLRLFAYCQSQEPEPANLRARRNLWQALNSARLLPALLTASQTPAQTWVLDLATELRWLSGADPLFFAGVADLRTVTRRAKELQSTLEARFETEIVDRLTILQQLAEMKSSPTFLSNGESIHRLEQVVARLGYELLLMAFHHPQETYRPIVDAALRRNLGSHFLVELIQATLDLIPASRRDLQPYQKLADYLGIVRTFMDRDPTKPFSTMRVRDLEALRRPLSEYRDYLDSLGLTPKMAPARGRR